MRIGGLATGINTDQMIKDLMRAERIPLDKLFQKRQVADWQRDAFREINLSLSKFRDAYSKMRLQSTYKAFGVNSSNESILKGTAGVNAAPGTYDVVVNNIAKVAKLRSENQIRNLNSNHAVTGTGPLTAAATATGAITVDVGTIANDEVLTIDGKTVHFYNSNAGGAADTTNYDYSIDIYDSAAAALKTSENVASEIQGLNFGANVGLTINATNAAQIDIAATSAGAVGNDIITSYSDADGISGTGNLTGGTDSDTITVSSIPKSGDILTISNQTVEFYDSTDGGAASGNSNFAIDISGKTTTDIATDVRGLAVTGVTLGGTGDDLTITASTTGVASSYSSNNGAKSTDKVLTAGSPETFTLSNEQGSTATIAVTDKDTYASLAKKISEAKDADGNALGIRATFDDTTSRFFISSKEMGGNQGFTFENTTFVQDQILGGGTNFSATGEYGSITFDGILIDDLTLNKTTVNEIDLSLVKADPNETVTLTVKSDTESAFNNIKEFVESYNELIAEIEGKLSETKYRDYSPLTDEQRKDLSEKEADLWDEKAKSGLLRNDPMLRSVLTDLRRSLGDPVEGIVTGEIKQLSEIGITTGHYSEGGKLFINENKLKSALTDRPDEVMNLFSKKAEVAGNESQMGLGMRVYENINDSIKELKRKAGSSLTLADQSVLGKNITRINDQINRWEDRLLSVEDRYFRQFTAMERAINQLNQQSVFITQNMFGGSEGQ
jgi:flagellar hook-associated protein 2